MIDVGQQIPAGMKSHRVYATLVEAVPATSHAPLTRVRAALVKDHTDQVPDKSFAADLKRKLALRKVMHPDDDKKEQDKPPEGLKFLKEDVNYRYAADPKRSCGECVYFRSGSCEIVSGLIRSVDMCDKFEGQERGVVVAVLVDTNEATEITPPGYEHVVRALKKKYDPKTGIPWAIAWSMKNRGIKPRKMNAESEGGPGSGPQPRGGGVSGKSLAISRMQRLSPRQKRIAMRALRTGGPGSGPQGGRSKFAPDEHEPSERVRVETPKQRKARIKQMRVDPERAAVIKKALGTVRASLVAY